MVVERIVRTDDPNSAVPAADRQPLGDSRINRFPPGLTAVIHGVSLGPVEAGFQYVVQVKHRPDGAEIPLRPFNYVEVSVRGDGVGLALINGAVANDHSPRRVTVDDAVLAEHFKLGGATPGFVLGTMAAEVLHDFQLGVGSFGPVPPTQGRIS